MASHLWAIIISIIYIGGTITAALVHLRASRIEKIPNNEQPERQKANAERERLEKELEQLKAVPAKRSFVSVSMISLRAEETTISRGRTLKIRYEIFSSEDVSEGVWLGASLGDGKGKGFSNTRQDKPITLLKGAHEYDRDLTIPADVLPGNYRLGANVWYGVLANGSKSVIIAPGRPAEIVVVA